MEIPLLRDTPMALKTDVPEIPFKCCFCGCTFEGYHKGSEYTAHLDNFHSDQVRQKLVEQGGYVEARKLNIRP